MRNADDRFSPGEPERLTASSALFSPGVCSLVLLLLLQVVSRYLPSPWAVLVMDDWTNLARSGLYASYADAAKAMIWDPARPLSMVAVEVFFRLFDAQTVYWTALSVIGNSLLVIFLAKIAVALTQQRAAGLLAGAMYILLPNLTQTFHWSTQVLNQVACAMVPYVCSAWCWVSYLRRGGGWRLAVGTVFYGAALFSYEQGLFLPAAFMVLLPWRTDFRGSLLKMIPFGLAVLLYASWRATDAFGMSTYVYPPHMQVGISLWSISWNARQLVHWWAGDHFFGAVLAGLESFSTLPPWTRRGLVLGNIAMLVGVGGCLVGLRKHEAAHIAPQQFSRLQILSFAVVWSGATAAISLVSYTAPRLNVLPALGLSLAAGVLLTGWPVRRWGPVLFLSGLLAMMSNQGTAESYRQAGLFNQRLYEHLRATREIWQEKEAIVFDTSGVRHRQTRGLLAPVTQDPTTWAFTGNALLLRGFVPRGMLMRIEGTLSPSVERLHDVENGVRRDGELVHWHARYDASRSFSTPLNAIYCVDVHQVTMETDGARERSQ